MAVLWDAECILRSMSAITKKQKKQPCSLLRDNVGLKKTEHLDSNCSQSGNPVLRICSKGRGMTTESLKKKIAFLPNPGNGQLDPVAWLWNCQA